MGPAPRGEAIESAWGQNLHQNFKTFDRYDSGIATSIKSYDLNLPSFGKENGIWLRGKRDINAVINFDEYTLSGRTIGNSLSPINERRLRIAIPRNPTHAQQAEFNRLQQYGADNDVLVTWERF